MTRAPRRVWLALGSNLGDRLEQLRGAVAALGRGGVVLDAVSSVYETPPWGGVEQPDYLNAVVTGLTSLTPQGLLALCKDVEAAAGRDFGAPRNSARPIDVDILLIDGEPVSTFDLTVPHAAMHLRAFVLVPFAEIGPNVVHPGLGRTVAELLATLPDEDRQGIRPAHPSGWASLR